MLKEHMAKLNKIGVKEKIGKGVIFALLLSFCYFIFILLYILS